MYKRQAAKVSIRNHAKRNGANSIWRASRDDNIAVALIDIKWQQCGGNIVQARALRTRSVRITAA